jgi:hypothetical protein
MASSPDLKPFGADDPKEHRMAVSRIIRMELAEGELSSIRSMFSDRSITDVYVRTREYDGVPAALVDTVRGRRIDRRRLDAAFERIGHQSSPAFRDRLAGALEATR